MQISLKTYITNVQCVFIAWRNRIKLCVLRVYNRGMSATLISGQMYKDMCQVQAVKLEKATMYRYKIKKVIMVKKYPCVFIKRNLRYERLHMNSINI